MDRKWVLSVNQCLIRNVSYHSMLTGNVSAISFRFTSSLSARFGSELLRFNLGRFWAWERQRTSVSYNGKCAVITEDDFTDVAVDGTIRVCLNDTCCRWLMLGYIMANQMHIGSFNWFHSVISSTCPTRQTDVQLKAIHTNVDWFIRVSILGPIISMIVCLGMCIIFKDLEIRMKINHSWSTNCF